mgnify:CR=1 FL=1
MADLHVSGLTMRFGGTTAIDDVSFQASDGELLTLLGPSGCGKSTTLWSIAGLHRPDAGRIVVGDTVLFDSERGTYMTPEERNCGVVFQSYAIWPHLTVAGNIAYPLKLRRLSRAVRAERVAEMLALVEMDGFGGRYPHELSGGQQQRVALARALAQAPRLLLLDEPFSNLDAKLRERARDWLRSMQQRLGITTIFVTHDQDEALSMSDTVVVMDVGAIRQIGTPEDVYRRPVDAFVAQFVGTTNLLDGEVVSVSERSATVRLDGFPDPLTVATDVAHAPGPVRVTLRPEALVVLPTAAAPAAPDPGATVLAATVEERAYHGRSYRYRLRVGTTHLVADSADAIEGDGGEVALVVPAGAARILPTETTTLTGADG